LFYHQDNIIIVLMIPPFQANGNLPAGIYWATRQEVQEHFGWNERRRELLTGLQQALESLQKAGCQTVYLNGSFVTSKDLPGDFDACWSWQGVDETKIDPVLLDFSNKRAAQKAKYGGELFPAEADAVGDGTTFSDFFQTSRLDGPKGIIAIDLRRMT
jgi:hypothetical protein